jgi:hypothetical protein
MKRADGSGFLFAAEKSREDRLARSNTFAITF